MKTETHSHHSPMALWIIIAFLAGAAAISLLFLVRGKSLQSQAYSVYGGPGIRHFSSFDEDCFGAGMMGPQVYSCLGLGGPSDTEVAPFQPAYVK